MEKYKINKGERYIEVKVIEKNMNTTVLKSIIKSLENIDKNIVLNLNNVEVIEHNCILNIQKWIKKIEINKSLKLYLKHQNKIYNKLRHLELYNTISEAVDIIYIEEIEKEFNKMKE